MAHMIPDVAPETIRNEGERLVYDALMELPNDFTVLHSYPWLRPDRHLSGTPLREGEADFVLLSPKEGILILEVKGGEPFLERGQWYREFHGEREPMKDPFKQANRNTFALLKEIEEKSRGQLKRHDMVYGYAVFFPHATRQGELPANSDPTVLLTAHDLHAPAAAIHRAFEAWRSHPRPLDERSFSLLVNAVLPRLRLVRVQGPQLQLDEQRLVQLTETQHQLLGSLLSSQRMLIEGVAGSGKTLLAYEAAVQAAISGKHTLLTCYNRHLAEWLRDRRDADPRAQQLAGRLTVAHFHKLASDLCRQAGVAFEPDGTDAFWKNRAPNLVINARLRLDQAEWQPYQALFIDEGQDFVEGWWMALEELLEDADQDQLHVFLDLHQRLWPDAGAPPLRLPPPLRLNVNCRNTRWIARTSATLASADVGVPPLAPLGTEPRIVTAPSRAAQLGLLEQQVQWLLGHGLRPRQIAVIGPSSLTASPLRQRSELAGHPLTGEASEWRQGLGLLCTTARAFKGLEADAVVLYDVEDTSEWFTDADLYVACTRAKHMLVMIVHGKPMKQRVNAAIQAVGRDM